MTLIDHSYHKWLAIQKWEHKGVIFWLILTNVLTIYILVLVDNQILTNRNILLHELWPNPNLNSLSTQISQNILPIVWLELLGFLCAHWCIMSESLMRGYFQNCTTGIANIINIIKLKFYLWLCFLLYLWFTATDLGRVNVNWVSISCCSRIS